MDALTYLRTCKSRTKGAWHNASHWLIGEEFIKKQDISAVELKRMGYKENTYKHAIDKLRELGFKFERIRKGRYVIHSLVGIDISSGVYVSLLTKEQKLWKKLLSSEF